MWDEEEDANDASQLDAAESDENDQSDNNRAENEASSSDDGDDDDSVADPSDDDQWIDVEDEYSPDPLPFTGAPGFKADDQPHDTPYEIFKLFVTDDVINLMVVETNRFAAAYVAGTAPNHRVRQEWREVDHIEMEQFIGLLFLMGTAPKKVLAHYWARDLLKQAPAFSKYMKRDRFMYILRFLHFADNAAAAADDRESKLRQIQAMLIARAQSVYIPDKEVSIDEELVLWRGRLVFRQYIPGKRHKYGIKLFVLCDPHGYAYNWQMYTGKTNAIAGFGLSESVVLKLMEPLLDKGYNLYTDNFYTSYPLAIELLRRQTTLCGTLRKNRKHVSLKVKAKKLKKGECVAQRKGQVMVCKWKDKRDVSMLSTKHTGRIVTAERNNRQGEEIKKPDAVLEYNKFMGGVDRLDQLLSYYTPLRKTVKWYRKVVVHLLDICMNNAYIVYQHLGGTKPSLWFRETAICHMLGAAVAPPQQTVQQAPLYNYKFNDLTRFEGQHFPGCIGNVTNKFRRCIVCTRNGGRKDTRFWCETCTSKPALCPAPVSKCTTLIDC